MTASAIATASRIGQDIARELRQLPSVDAVLATSSVPDLVQQHGREAVRAAVRRALDAARARIRRGEPSPLVTALVAEAREALDREGRPSLRRVINASGVVVHTNLGRAPLSEQAAAAMLSIARGYSNLEYDLRAGTRGSRYTHCSALLAQLSGADDAVVVNNNASSVMLLLAALAREREVIVSRGQLVEIGGGFRIPDVMRESGAHLVEVGTTNRTYVRDYEAAITDRTAAVMLIHRSNFRLTGFVHDPDVAELAQMAHARGLLLIDDVGSGTLLDTIPYGLPHEPTVQERVAAGADIVCFSGDKLLGGPQAGYIVGRRPLIDTIRGFPMLRALRVDKVSLAGIEATLRHYVRGDVTTHIPIWRSIASTVDELEARARRWQHALGLEAPVARVVPSTSAVGGGSLPGLTVPTVVLALHDGAVNDLAARLRTGDPPVVGRIEDDAFLLDPRTVMPDEDASLVQALRAALDVRRA
jgi:L-seryl-tRNA(Ser) seleniumtransferase